MPKLCVIDSGRESDGQAAFAERNPAIEFEYVGARDPVNAEPDPAWLASIRAATRYSAAEQARALSHCRMWHEAMQRNQALTIVESSAVLRSDFLATHEHLIGTLDADWDLILWGWNFDSILSLLVMPGVSPVVFLCKQDALSRSIDRFVTHRYPPQALPLDRCCGVPAYSISPMGARKFSQLCFPMDDAAVFFPVYNKRLTNTGIDIAMSRAYSKTMSYVCVPPLAIDPAAVSSSSVNVRTADQLN